MLTTSENLELAKRESSLIDEASHHGEREDIIWPPKPRVTAPHEDITVDSLITDNPLQ
jgi:hypothetical protein